MKIYDVRFIEHIEHTVTLEAEDSIKAEEIAKRTILDCYDNEPDIWPEGVFDFCTDSLGVAQYAKVSERT